jgi:hypothetical protein
MGGTSGNIGAIPFTKSAVTFSPHPPGSKEDAKNSLHPGRIILMGEVSAFLLWHLFT